MFPQGGITAMAGGASTPPEIVRRPPEPRAFESAAVYGVALPFDCTATAMHHRMLAGSGPMLRRLTASLFMVVAAAGVAGAAVHLALVKSDPANGATLPKAPKAITLWFSQRPNVKLTRLVLTRAPGDTVKTGTPAAVDTAGKQIRVSVDTALAPGTYAVSWRTLARDGHAVAGKLTFTMSRNMVQSGSSSTAPAPTLGTRLVAR
ncbi:MAG: copper resistance CopC family protein [Gemmatimonadaceae bacterium]